MNSGLAVTDANDLNKNSFIVSAVLMALGSSAFLLLPTIAFRIYKLRQLMPFMEMCLQNIEEKLVKLDQSDTSSQSAHGLQLRASTISYRMTSAKLNPVKPNEILKNEALYIKQYMNLYHASIATFITVLVYILSWLCLGKSCASSAP